MVTAVAHTFGFTVDLWQILSFFIISYNKFLALLGRANETEEKNHSTILIEAYFAQFQVLKGLFALFAVPIVRF